MSTPNLFDLALYGPFNIYGLWPPYQWSYFINSKTIPFSDWEGMASIYSLLLVDLLYFQLQNIATLRPSNSY